MWNLIVSVPDHCLSFYFLKDPLLKIYVSLLFLVSKSPRFSVRGRSARSPMFSEWPLPKRPPPLPHFHIFKFWAAHIPLSYMSIPQGFIVHAKSVAYHFKHFIHSC